MIVALGSLQSPKLLQLSGIGPREVLDAAGVPVYLDRENVGRGLREHRCATLRLELREDLGYNRKLSSNLGQALTGMRYLATRKGPLATPSFDVLAFVKSRPEVERVDGQLLLGPWTIPPYNTGEPVAIQRQAGVSCLGMVLRPTSLVRAEIYRRMRDLFAQSPIAERISHETYPGTDVKSDDELVEAALDGGFCGYHAVGSCAMGPGDDDVVDSRLRVRGIDNLRVVDCSVMPTMVAGNLNGPIMAMAARAADFIIEDR